MIPPLTNIQLAALLPDAVILSYDQIPTRVECLPASYIFNTDKSDEAGTHWISIFFDGERRCQYFCPLATEPYGDFYDFVEKNSREAFYNKTTVQAPLSSLCGYYCVYHLAHAARGYSLTDVVNRFSPTDWPKNEKKVLDFVEKILDSRL